MSKITKFSECKTAEATKTLIAEITKATPLDDIKKHIALSFYNADEIVELLYYSMIAKGNAILYGPGGFGKSQITKAFFNYLKIPMVSKVGFSDMELEALIGMINIKKFLEDGEHEIAFEKSMFGISGVLILEEFLEVRASLAIALKDIMTEGGFRDLDKFINSLIGSVVICSNKSPDEVSTDLSTAAFYKERFPYSLYVIWDSFSTNSYLNMFDLIYDIEDDYTFELVSRVCAESYKNDTIVSPRMAISAMNIVISSGTIKSLRFVPGIDTSKLDMILEELEIVKMYKELGTNLLNITEFIKSASLDTIEQITAFLSFSINLKTKLKSPKFKGDKLLAIIANTLKVLDIKTTKANSLLFDYGILNFTKLDKLNTSYENIQKYIS